MAVADIHYLDFTYNAVVTTVMYSRYMTYYNYLK